MTDKTIFVPFSADVFSLFPALLLTTLPETEEEGLLLSHQQLSVSAQLHPWFCTFALVVLVQPQVEPFEVLTLSLPPQPSSSVVGCKYLDGGDEKAPICAVSKYY